MTKPRKSSVIVLRRQLLASPAWWSLSATAMKVYMIFLTKRKMGPLQTKKKRSRNFVCLNNGEIVFTYQEARTKYGLTASRFRRALDELIETGFIDITATGAGLYKVATLYAVAERWQEYGTPDFVRAERPRRGKGYPGFKKGNTAWQKSLKKKATVIRAHGAMRIDEHGPVLAMRTNAHGQKVAILYKWSKTRWLESQIA
ncbi:MAG: hypothetical protein JSW27_02160 [Phycisphaerales bacterium]|nr:MAG: hypothetical protein JSW27_02160 [Phycisphaerales bacterium]